MRYCEPTLNWSKDRALRYLLSALVIVMLFISRFISPAPILIVGFVSLVGSIYCLVVLVPRKTKATNLAWKSFADQLGLNFELDLKKRRVSGRYRDHRLVLDTLRWYTRLTVELNTPSKATVAIYRRGSGYLTRDIVAGEIIKLGDPSFDKKFTVKGNNEPLVREMLDSLIRQQLMELKKLRIVIEESQACYEEENITTDPTRLRQISDLVTDLAIRFEKRMD